MDELIIKYCRNKCSEKELESFLCWINESQENRDYYKKIRELWDLNTLLYNPVNEEIVLQKYSEFKLLIKTDKGKSARCLKKQNPLHFWLKIAAALVLGLGLFIYYSQQSSQKSVVWNKIEVPAGQRIHVTLADGTRVWLNSESKLFYPANFSKTEREVRLDGEAYFEVVHDAKHPFTVDTKYTDVEVKGTRFNVCAYSRFSFVTTTLIEGKVLLTLQNKSHDVFEMEPNQQIRYDSDKDRITVIKDRDTTTSTDWLYGIWGVVDIPFKDLIQQLEQHYAITVSVRNKSLFKYRCTGKFRNDEPLDDVLKVIQISIPFKYRKEGDKIIINK